jgi:hypothetical protein
VTVDIYSRLALLELPRVDRTVTATSEANILYGEVP